MHTFKVVKDRYGWAVHIGNGMTTPFWTLALAIREANCLCAELRGHGVAAEVVVEDDPAPNDHETHVSIQPKRA